MADLQLLDVEPISATALAVPADLPRTYVPSPFNKLLVTAGGLILIFFGFLPIAMFFGSRSSTYNRSTPWMLLLGLNAAVLSFVALRSILAVFRSKLVWSSDSIEISDSRGSHRIKIADILGRRSAISRSGRTVKLVLATPGAKDVKIAMDYVLPFDRDFRDWIDALPDLDAADKQQRRTEGRQHLWERSKS
jgi:hypothetical protein